MIENTKTLLDTNILIYAGDLSSPYHQECQQVLQNRDHFYVVDRSLLEFYRAATGPLKQRSQTALNQVRFYQNHSKYTILTATDFTNQLTFKLAEENQARSGRIFDLNILAIAMENEIDILMTKNTRDFPQDTKVKIVDPTV